ncbi:hypothetical protein BC831DRAFT_441269 [Entophlyctis helioformis]|nr:hypothetical protein BC831DRAFT_441269 [Entophlyctis helioformis]
MDASRPSAHANARANADGASATAAGSANGSATLAPPQQHQQRQQTRTSPAAKARQRRRLTACIWAGAASVITQLIEEAKLAKKPGDVIVVNDARLLAVPPAADGSVPPPVFLGHVVYTGARSRNPHSNRAADLQLFLLPQFTAKQHYATIEVRVPAEFLTYRGNIAVRKSALWGTDIYTDDRTWLPVELIIHSGHYRPVDAPDPAPEEKKAPAAAASAPVSASASGNAAATSATGQPAAAPDGALLRRRSSLGPIVSPIEPLVAVPDPGTLSHTMQVPDHDLHVTLRILPKLVKYTGSTRYDLDSRGWGASHDGESVQVESVYKVERGSVGRKGRKVFSKRWGELAKTVTKEDDFLVFDGSAVERHPDTDVDDEAGDVTVVFSRFDGAPCIKYMPKIMVDWPSHLLNTIIEVKQSIGRRRSVIAPPAAARPGQTGAVSTLAGQDETESHFTKKELEAMSDWPYWRVKLSKYTCYIEGEDGTRHELRRADPANLAYHLIKLERVPRDKTVPGSKSSVRETAVFSLLRPQAITWTESGLSIQLEGSAPLAPHPLPIAIPVSKVYWSKTAAGGQTHSR